MTLPKNRKNKYIVTLVDKVKNKIYDINDYEIRVISEETGNERTLKKKDFEYFWRILSEKGCIEKLDDLPKLKGKRISAIIRAIFAELPYISVKPNPNGRGVILTLDP